MITSKWRRFNNEEVRKNRISFLSVKVKFEIYILTNGVQVWVCLHPLVIKFDIQRDSHPCVESHTQTTKSTGFTPRTGVRWTPLLTPSDRDLTNIWQLYQYALNNRNVWSGDWSAPHVQKCSIKVPFLRIDSSKIYNLIGVYGRTFPDTVDA